jgi:hypothetical protein
VADEDGTDIARAGARELGQGLMAARYDEIFVPENLHIRFVVVEQCHGVPCSGHMTVVQIALRYRYELLLSLVVPLLLEYQLTSPGQSTSLSPCIIREISCFRSS